MTRRQKNPLRILRKDERLWLKRIARSTSEPASHVARAKQLLAVADGFSYTAAAHLAGRKSGDAVAQLIACFNDEGLKVIEPRRGGGRKPTMARLHANGFCKRHVAHQTRSKMARPVGH